MSAVNAVRVRVHTLLSIFRPLTLHVSQPVVFRAPPPPPPQSLKVSTSSKPFVQQALQPVPAATLDPLCHSATKGKLLCLRGAGHVVVGFECYVPVVDCNLHTSAIARPTWLGPFFGAIAVPSVTR